MLLEKQFADPKYLHEYGGKGYSYADVWQDFTFSPLFLRAVFEQISVQTPITILDAGAATGVLQRQVCETFPYVKVAHGVEISSVLVEQRVEPNVFHGDLLDLVGLARLPLLEKYDVILCNCLMYFSEDELHLFLGTILPRFCTKSTLIVLSLAIDVSPYLISKYNGGEFSLNQHMFSIVARPKFWWLSKLVEYGYKILLDWEGGCLALSYTAATSSLNLGDPDVIEVKYPRNNANLLGLHSPVYLSADSGDYLFSRALTEAGREVWQEHCDNPRASSETLACMASVARKGVLGRITNMVFNPSKRLNYYPGLTTIYDFEDCVWHTTSDPCLGFSASVNDLGSFLLDAPDYPTVA